MPRNTRMNKLTSPELLAQVNPNNIALLDDFLSYLKSIQRSDGTCTGYKHDMSVFFVWILQHANNKDFKDVTKRDIVAFQNWLINDNKNSPARVRRIKGTISSLSNFIENILDDDPDYKGFRSIVKKVENPALQPVRDKTVLTDKQVDKLLNKLVDAGKIEQCIAVALALYSGRRKAELARFQISDFAEDKLICDGALYKSAPIRTKGRSNGKFIPCYTLAKNIQPYLDLWLEYRKEHGIDSPWFLPDPDVHSQQISISTLNSWAKTFSRILGVEFYWHACRHYYTTYLAKAGIPDSVITEIVGWESVEMVKVYNDTDKDEQIAEFFKNGEISADKKPSIL